MKKSNRQRVYEYLKAVNEKPKSGVFVVFPVDENGEIVGDKGQFSTGGEHIEEILESEVEKRIPPAFLNGWLAGRGIRRQKNP